MKDEIQVWRLAGRIYSVISVTSTKPGYIKYIQLEKTSNGTIDSVQSVIKFNGHPDGDYFGRRVSLSRDSRNLAVSGYKNTKLK